MTDCLPLMHIPARNVPLRNTFLSIPFLILFTISLQTTSTFKPSLSKQFQCTSLPWVSLWDHHNHPCHTWTLPSYYLVSLMLPVTFQNGHSLVALTVGINSPAWPNWHFVPLFGRAGHMCEREHVKDNIVSLEFPSSNTPLQQQTSGRRSDGAERKLKTGQPKQNRTSSTNHSRWQVRWSLAVCTARKRANEIDWLIIVA